MPQLSHLLNGKNNYTFLTELLGLIEEIHGKYIAHFLACHMLS